MGLIKWLLDTKYYLKIPNGDITMAESTQHKLDRVRPPRVQITYDVEVGDAIQLKELPMVVGVMSDLSGKREDPLEPIKARKFVEIDRDNFDDVLESCKPGLAFQVDNKLSDADDDSQMNVKLSFSDMEDFEPVNVLKQVEPMRRLFKARNRLRDLLTKLDGNDELDGLLRQVISSTEDADKLRGELEKRAKDDGDADAG
jgi:type VI secretion system protein ImpB